jgi:hypothetical protein
VRYLRRVWSIGCSDLHRQLEAAFETANDLAMTLDRMIQLKELDPSKHVWAAGDFYDIETSHTEGGEVGFLVRPTIDLDHPPPSTCLPYSATELLGLAATGTVVLPAADHCSSCGDTRRGRYANRDASHRPLFLCSACERWSETLPSVGHPAHRSRESELAE